MQIVRWDDPFAGLNSLHSQLDDMFNGFLSGTTMPAMAASMPTMDVYTEGDKQLVAEVQIPGFNKDDIEIHVHDGTLEIRGEHKDKEEQKDKKRSYMVRESHASFYRRIGLPKHADTDKIQAEFDNGILKVMVPFKELPAPKKVTVKLGKGSGKDKK